LSDEATAGSPDPSAQAAPFATMPARMTRTNLQGLTFQGLTFEDLTFEDLTFEDLNFEGLIFEGLIFT
jgi:uncharacterized protein YjbI with pentapeptide repeats